MDEILETAFLMYDNNTGILEEFPLYRSFNIWLTNGKCANLVVLYNPENRRKKFLVSDYLEGDDIMRAWKHRWSIETFHNDAKDLGMGECVPRNRYILRVKVLHSNCVYDCKLEPRTVE